jgi:hypothetical protein
VSKLDTEFLDRLHKEMVIPGGGRDTALGASHTDCLEVTVARSQYGPRLSRLHA